MTLSSSLKKANANRNRSEPLWRGPEQDGITFSLLSRFLSCRERFRLLVVEGLKPADKWNHRTGYGNMWHVCEEGLAKAPPSKTFDTKEFGWQRALFDNCRDLCRRYPYQQEEIDKWYNVCKVQFPVYVDYWSKHQDVKNRTPLLQEQVFDVPYKLPCGRIVRLRGKWDSVDLCGMGREKGIYLQENKTKGDINELQIKRQVSFDLQTMMYLVALEVYKELPPFHTARMVAGTGPDRILGVRYNVVRRPLSGGAKGNIRQHQAGKPTKSGKLSKKVAETKEQFYARLGSIIKAEAPTYFMRWKIEIMPGDILKFRRECLDPILEQLCSWWEWVNDHSTEYHKDRDGRFFDPNSGIHWRHPFGVYNPMDEGNASDVDEYLATGNEVGLQRTNNLFPELT